MTLTNIYAWLYGINATLSLTILSLLGGTILGLFISIAGLKKIKWLGTCLNLFVFIIKGTPMLVQIFFIYYGLPHLNFIKKTILWELFKNPFFCGWLALSINSAAYMSSIITNAISLVPHKYVLSAKSLGLTNFMIGKRIIFPLTLKNLIPAYVNEASVLLKATALTASITIFELMSVANKNINASYDTCSNLFIVSIIYIILNKILTYFIELVFNKHLNNLP